MNSPQGHQSTGHPSAPPPAVSVIITWKDRPVIGETIRRNWPILGNDRYETVVVNCGGDRRALDGLLSGVGDGRLKIIEAPRERFNKCFALNVGVAASTGGSLFFLDTDVIMVEDVVGLTVSRLDGTNFVTVKWLIESESRARSTEIGEVEVAQIMEITLPGGRKSLVETNRLRPIAGARWGGGMIAIERRHFLAIGGMNSALEGWGWEDNDLIARLQFALNLQRVQIGEVTHLTHGDAERSLGGLSKEQTEHANWLKCMANYATGNFGGTFLKDVSGH